MARIVLLEFAEDSIAEEFVQCLTTGDGEIIVSNDAGFTGSYPVSSAAIIATGKLREVSRMLKKD